MGITSDELKQLCTVNKRGVCCNRSFSLIHLTRRNNIAHLATQNTTAFVTPSAAL